jgi:hypothetical protein
MYTDPTTTRLIHDTMIREELERHGPAHLRRHPEPIPMRGLVAPARAAAAGALHRLAARIAPAPSPERAAA